MKRTLYIIYLDAYHLGDRIFINDLAEQIGSASDMPCLLVHGSGEKVERTLESKGFFPERTDGVLDVSEPEHIQLVERAVRETNQHIVGTLTDAVVPTVGAQGVDRSLLQLDEEGSVTASQTGWLAALLKQQVVPVISALVEHPTEGRVREVNAADAAVALAEALDDFDPTVVFFTRSNRPGLADANGTLDSVPEDALDAHDALPDAAAVRRVAAAGLDVLMTSLEGLFAGGTPAGTRLA